jgi:hypothetical protein
MSKRDRTYTGKSGLPPGFWLSPSELTAKTAGEAHPEVPARAIAADVGVSDKTVAKARRSTAESSAVEKRTGRGHRARKPPKRAKTAAAPPAKARRRDPVYVIDGLTYADLLAQSRAILS